MARRVLDNPPPITPARLRNFPYAARPFPTRWLLDHSPLKSAPAPSPAEPEASRVE